MLAAHRSMNMIIMTGTLSKIIIRSYSLLEQVAVDPPQHRRFNCVGCPEDNLPFGMICATHLQHSLPFTPFFLVLSPNLKFCHRTFPMGSRPLRLRRCQIPRSPIRQTSRSAPDACQSSKSPDPIEVCLMLMKKPTSDNSAIEG